MRTGSLIFLILMTAKVGAQSPLQVVSTMAAKEVAARNQDTLYSYKAEETSSRTGGHRWTEKVVEAKDGPLHRLLAIDGRALNAQETKAEADRIDAVLRHPEEFRRLGKAHKGDEARAEQLLQLLPKAFLLEPAGEADGCKRFAFRPNPAFQPSSLEERIAVAMEGTVSTMSSLNRLCRLQATVMHPVEIGFGLLGKVEKGGTFDLRRAPADSTHWKSDLISVHMRGSVLMLKTITREQDIRRTEIRLIPQDTTLEQAARLIAANP